MSLNCKILGEFFEKAKAVNCTTGAGNSDRDSQNRPLAKFSVLKSEQNRPVNKLLSNFLAAIIRFRNKI